MFKHLVYSNNDVLTFDGCALDEICQKYGTPLFIASARKIESNVKRFFNTFSHYENQVLLSYSTKTNSNIGILEILRKAGTHAGVCSILDYTAARRAGFPPEKIIYDGLVKKREDLTRAIRDGVGLINVESWEELVMINEISRQLNRVTPVGLRIRIGSSPFHSLSVKSLLGIGYDRFGFDLRSGLAERVIDKADGLTNIRIEGLLVHEGSHFHTAGPYINNFRELTPLIRKLSHKTPGRFKYLNLGGGFGVATVKPYNLGDLIRNTFLRLANQPVHYDLQSKTTDLEKMAKDIVSEVTTFFSKEKLTLPILVFEPGRYVVGDAFVLASKILLRKKVPGSGIWLILDAGTNLFPYLLSFNEYHQIMPVLKDQGKREVVHLAGPLLYSSDIVMKNCSLPHLEEGSLLAIHDAGAYTLAYSNQFLYPRPAVVLIDHDRNLKVIREAESIETVLKQDRSFLQTE